MCDRQRLSNTCAKDCGLSTVNDNFIGRETLHLISINSFSPYGPFDFMPTLIQSFRLASQEIINHLGQLVF